MAKLRMSILVMYEYDSEMSGPQLEDLAQRAVNMIEAPERVYRNPSDTAYLQLVGVGTTINHRYFRKGFHDHNQHRS